jgi:chemotaxis protein CheD
MFYDPATRSVIGIGGLAVRPGHGTIVTHALGSCLGIALWCPTSKFGGMVHAQLPLSSQHPQRFAENPHLFVDAGTRALLDKMIAQGAVRRGLKLYVAGAANLTGAAENDLFNIGNRNLTVLRKVLFQLQLLITAEDTGGAQPRTMTLDAATGRLTIASQGGERLLSR